MPSIGQAATTAPSPRRCVNFVPSGTVSWQVFGLCRLPTCSGFPAFRPVLFGAFVPAYRCGAVPAFHRIPFSVPDLATSNTMKFTHYSKGLLPGQRQYIGVFLHLFESFPQQALQDGIVKPCICHVIFIGRNSYCRAYHKPTIGRSSQPCSPSNGRQNVDHPNR